MGDEDTAKACTGCGREALLRLPLPASSRFT
jgi:hypothetical protein